MTPATVNPPGTVDALVARACAGAPADAVALIHGDRRVTYRALGELTGRAAALLASAGVTAGGYVGVQMSRSAEAFAVMLAAMRLGAAYVPLDRNDPPARVTHVAATARMTVLVTDADAGAPAVPDVRVLPVAPDDLAGGGAPAPAVPADPGAAAYAIFTSGSTGAPKGVPMTHRALVNMLTWHERVRPGSNALRTAQVCAVSFDFSFHEIFSTLAHGGTLVVVPDSARQNPFELAEFLVHHRVERLFLPVVLLRQLAQVLAGAPDLPPVREVVTTGERLVLTPAMRTFFRRTGARLHNHYGATEFQDALTYTPAGDPDRWPDVVPAGRPIDNVSVAILGADGCPVPPGETGELCVGGAGVGLGYLGRPDLTAQRFAPGVAGPGTGFRTGDLARQGSDGVLEILGRVDDQVKVRGVRVETAEIEVHLGTHPAVAEAVVVAHPVDGDTRLVAHLTTVPGRPLPEPYALHTHLAATLPPAMLPEAYVRHDALPLTSSGKLDRRRLHPPATFDRLLPGTVVAPRTPTERVVADVWCEVLRLTEVSARDAFADLGGTSVLLVQVQQRLSERLGRDVSVADLMRHPTVAEFAAQLDRPSVRPPAAAAAYHPAPEPDGRDIAVVGMAGRFPGAADVDALWRNLRDGVESVRPVPGDGTDGHVAMSAPVDGIEEFDAGFFGLNAQEARLLDPQQRLFLECAHEALESAGYGDAAAAGRVGVYAGAGFSTYLVNNLLPHFGLGAGRPLTEADLLQFQLKLGNDTNYLATRVAYLLNLHGPALTVQAACSTSLVAVHLAVRSLRSGDTDLALAGGVHVTVPQDHGYEYIEGMVQSPDGHTRAFDADAGGTMFGNGCGVVALKRLADAIRDGDPVLAVIKGSAINNDGAGKSGFTGPGLDRQTDVIRAALADADVEPRAVGYVEAHSVGTPLGDGMEIAALTEAYRPVEGRTGRCAIGSLKTNIGHLDEAAGIAALIKTILQVRAGELVPSLHFRRPHPGIGLDGSPFTVNTGLRPWTSDGPRTAGVSAFGVGGTNCHVIVQEAPPRPDVREPHAGPMLLPLSARSETALRELAGRYRDLLTAGPVPDPADVCHTAAVGRRHFEHRAGVVADTVAELCDRLGDLAAGRRTGPAPVTAGPVRLELEAAARLYESGAAPPERAGNGQRRVPLPTYPWQRTRHWIDPPAGAGSRPAPGGAGLLGRRLDQADDDGVRFDTVLGPDTADWIRDHRMFGTPMLPGGAYLVLALTAAAEARSVTAGVGIRDLTIHRALSFPDDEPRQMQVLVRPDGPVTRLTIHSRPAGFPGAGSPWVRHADAEVETLPGVAPDESRTTLASLWRRLRDSPVDLEAVYAGERARDIELGAALRTVDGLWSDGTEALAKLVLPAGAGADRLLAHPALVQGCLTALHAMCPAGRTWVPVGVETIAFARPAGERAWGHVRLRAGSGAHTGTVCADLDVRAEDGAVLLAMRGIVLRPASADRLAPAGAPWRSWLHHTTWEPAAPSAPGRPGRWLLVSADPMAPDLAGRLGTAGITCDLVAEPADAGDLADHDLVVLLPAAGADVRDALAVVLDAVREVALADGPGRPRVRLVTRGGLPVAGRGVHDPAHAGLAGFGRTVGAELPEVDFGHLDLDPADGPDRLASLLAAEVPAASGAVQTGWRAGRAYVPRLRRLRLPPGGPGTTAAVLRPDRSYLVTGAFGGLGPEVAASLAEWGAGHLLLAGRQPPGAEAGRRLDALRRGGTQVVTVVADVADPVQAAGVVARCGSDLPPLAGVFHLAGAHDDGLLLLQSADRLERVLAPKARGAMNLHRLTRHGGLDHFVLFSSTTGLLGARHRSADAAAAAFLDGLAEHRRALGLPALSVQWHVWAEAGLHARAGRDVAAIDRGDPVIPLKDGLGALAELLAAPGTPPVVAVLPGVPGRDHAVPRDLSDARSGAAGGSVPPPRPGPHGPEHLTGVVRDCVAAVLGLPDRPEPGDDLFAGGLDSLTAVELRLALQRTVGVPLPQAVIFEHPTPRALGEAIAALRPDVTG